MGEKKELKAQEWREVACYSGHPCHRGHTWVCGSTVVGQCPRLIITTREHWVSEAVQVCHHSSLNTALWTAGLAAHLLWGGVDGMPFPIATLCRKEWAPAQLPMQGSELTRLKNLRMVGIVKGPPCCSKAVGSLWHSTATEQLEGVLMRIQYWCCHRSYSFHDGMFFMLCSGVVCVLFILGEVAWAKVGYEGMSGIGLHDVKQGIKKKEKKSRGHIFIAKI